MKHICLFIFAFIVADMLVNMALAAKANGTAEEYTSCDRAGFSGEDMDRITINNPYVALYSGGCPVGYTEIQERITYVCGYQGYEWASGGYSGANDFVDCFLYLDPQMRYSDSAGTFYYGDGEVCPYEP